MRLFCPRCCRTWCGRDFSTNIIWQIWYETVNFATFPLEHPFGRHCPGTGEMLTAQSPTEEERPEREEAAPTETAAREELQEGPRLQDRLRGLADLANAIADELGVLRLPLQDGCLLPGLYFFPPEWNDAAVLSYACGVAEGANQCATSAPRRSASAHSARRSERDCEAESQRWSDAPHADTFFSIIVSQKARHIQQTQNVRSSLASPADLTLSPSTGEAT